MVHYHYSVTGCVHIELDRVCAELQGAEKGRDRVFGQRVVSAPVRYSLGPFVRRWAQGAASRW